MKKVRQSATVKGHLPKFVPHPIDCLLRADRNEAALEAANRGIALDPKNAKMLRFKALALSGLRRYDEGLAVLDQAIILQPQNSVYRRLRALMLRNAGRYAEAFATLKLMTAEMPDDVELLGALSVSALRIGNKQRAIEAGKRRLGLLAAEAIAGAGTLPIRTPPPVGNIDRVAFSLWGPSRQYCVGAIANAEWIHSHLPKWEAIFYVGAGVPYPVIEALRAAGAFIIDGEREHPTVPPMFWRFLVHDMPGTRRYLIRDCDSRIGSRELAAVTEWIQSGRGFHILRDHIVHFELMLGGLWAGTGGRVFAMEERVASFRALDSAMQGYGHDQVFLRKMVWPWIRDDALVHDSHYKVSHSLPVPGGVIGDDQEHIGMGFLLPGTWSAGAPGRDAW